jgi:hypothetical protein
MVEACRPAVSIDARRNHNRDAARQIQCRAAARRMHHTVPALVNNEVPYYRGAGQHNIRTRLLTHPPVPETDPDNLQLSQRAANGAKDSISE